MAKADSRVGGESYHLGTRILCLSLESCVIIVAENQNEVNAHLVSSKHIYICLGTCICAKSTIFKQNIIYRISQINERKRRVDYATLCDGRGLQSEGLKRIFFQKHVN